MTDEKRFYPDQELCERFKELGGPQDDKCHRAIRPDGVEVFITESPEEWRLRMEKSGWKIYASPSIGQMGEWIEQIRKEVNDKLKAKVSIKNSIYNGLVRGDEANSRMKTLIWLLENNYVRPEDLK